MPIALSFLRPSRTAGAGPLRLVLATAALSAAAGAMATALLDRLASANAPARIAPPVASLPAAADGRDPSLPDAGIVLGGREAASEDPVPTF